MLFNTYNYNIEILLNGIVISCRVKDAPVKANKILQLFRLTKQEGGVFLKLNETTLALLQMVDPYVTWGHPNIRTVRDLIFKRGHGKIGKNERGSLSDNTFIEKALGK